MSRNLSGGFHPKVKGLQVCLHKGLLGLFLDNLPDKPASREIALMTLEPFFCEGNMAGGLAIGALPALRVSHL